jgi:multidrug efflux pump subunit AcrA (membrane-fusion protein)
VTRLLRVRTRLTAVVAVLVLGAAGVSGFALTRTAKAATGPVSTPVAAALGTIRQAVAASGTIEPASQDAVSFQVTGLVTAVNVSAGQTVQAGAVLATVDSATLQAGLAEAQATLAADQARVTADQNAAATATTITADQAAATAAQGQVTSAQNALGEATLTSPISGVVAAVNVTVGQQVSGANGSATGSTSSSGSSGTGGSGTGAGTSSTSSQSATSSGDFLVLSTSTWIANVSVDDTQVGLLANGEQAQIVPDGATAPVYGTISSVGLLASSASGVATYPVVVSITGSPTGLHAGATATVSLIYKQLTGVLTVPTAAVHLVNGTTVVYVMTGSKQSLRDVTVGLASGGLSQITSGLTAGEQVAVTRTAGRTGSGTGNTTTRTGGWFGGGGFGGGGLGGGGLGGGGLGGGGFGGGAGG